MARGVNKAIIVGNVGQDPEVRFLPSGVAVANISIATSEQWTDKQSGQKQERTEWHRCVLFDKLAEIAQQYVKKGSRLYVEGQIQTRKWQDQNGQDKYSTEIKVRDMQMLDSPSGGQQGGQPPQPQQPQQGGQYGAPQPQQQPPQRQAPPQQQQPQQQGGWGNAPGGMMDDDAPPF